MNNNEISNKLKDHIRCCPIGWFNGKLIHGRTTTEQDVIDWLNKLFELSGLYRNKDG